MFSLWDTVCHDCEPIKIIDVGAMIIDDKPADYHALLKPGVSKVVGFEPNKEECQKLNRSHTDNCLFLPYFIGDGNERNFNICNYNMTSSLYEPNIPLLEKFQTMSEVHQVVERTTVPTRRLDDIEEAKGADYLKIDVQGAEVDVFEGAADSLAEIMIVHTEVEFIPLYIDQPLFAEVDQIMRKNGFLFHKFNRHGMSGRTFKPVVINNDVNGTLSQILWSDAVYVKNFMDNTHAPAEKLLKLAVIMHDVYGSYDLVHYILQHYDKKSKSEYAAKYLSLLCKNGPL